VGDWGWFEATPGDRQDGRLFVAIIPHVPRQTDTVDTKPGCLVWAADHETEYSTRVAGGEQREAICKDILTRSRECSSWFGYQRGVSPKEHLDWYRMLTLEQLQLEVQKNSLAISENLKGIAEQTKTIQAEAKALTGRSDDFQRTWTRVAVALAIAALAIAAMSYFAPDFGRQFVSNLTGVRPTP
jgi:hypothetical protein